MKMKKALKVLAYLKNKLTNRIRVFYHRLFLAKVGKNIRIGRGVRFYGAENIYLGDNVEIKDYCIFYCRNATKVILKERVFGSL